MWSSPLSSPALAAATAAVIVLAALRIPGAGLLLMPLAPQPLLSVGLRRGRRWGIGASVLSLALLFLVGEQRGAWAFAPLCGMSVAALAVAGRGWPLERLVSVSAAAGALSGFGLLLFAFGSPGAVLQALEAELREGLESSVRFYERIGVPPEARQLLSESLPRVLDFLLALLPAIALVGLAAILLVNVYLVYRRVPEARASIAGGGDPREWRSPEGLVWGFIGSGFVLLLPAPPWLWTAALNVFAIAVAFYFFQGLAVVAYYFHHKHVPFFLRGLGYALIVLEQLFTLLVVGIGLFDLWVDFRRLNKKAEAGERRL
jgi:uncharacterized protein YybS (DUF2232 family)